MLLYATQFFFFLLWPVFFLPFLFSFWLFLLIKWYELFFFVRSSHTVALVDAMIRDIEHLFLPSFHFYILKYVVALDASAFVEFFFFFFKEKCKSV